MFGVTILGNNSALQAFDRHPTAQVVTMGDQLFLVDCGEGTQEQLAKYKIKRSKISTIFISHLHGDHYFGLIGLLTSMGLLNRIQPITIFAPAALREILQLQLNAADTVLPYPLIFHPLPATGLLLNDEKLSVECFPVQHRIACWGFIFRQKESLRKLDAPKLAKLKIPTSYFKALKAGEDYTTPTGQVYTNAELTIAGNPAKSYAYSADTLYKPDLAQYYTDANLLYHEATYLQDFADKAKARFHSTAREAGQMAQLARVRQLIIGHFSSKYEVLDVFLQEASSVFKETSLALEGCTFRVL